MKILLLEDEYTLRKSMQEFLEDCNYFVDGFSNGDDAFDAAYYNMYDLLLLDVNVPGMNGFELLEQLRERDIETPAIFITSFTEIDNLEKAYDIGCDDYIKKPFDLAELRLRVVSTLKQTMPKSKNNIIELALNYSYDTKKFVLKHHDDEIHLSNREKMILDLLIKHKNQVVTPDMISDYVWEENVDPANVRVQVNNLRKKLDHTLIVNVRGQGYKLGS